MAALHENHNVTWEKSEKTSLERSRSSSQSPSEPGGIHDTNTRNGNHAGGDETPRPQAMRSMSVASETGLPNDEPNWPSGWRPYACLFGGFLL
jgi:hypothetical protein